ncbi:NVEALA domain-containing protein [Bacteroides sp. KH569_7]|uniref:NVEALA domain-containing protein n=1 Tax=Bacteroides muris (ex Fokt et al. 2023) TaxID=2937417 RepID=A0A9X2NLN9_9BACE|nr:NVEALA domain-containing protein [Bacteroides muris (ex Fokt et al. 2023)]MCR6503198.1 NVEALA domain-containing protein [Bacteroides muris (ex Fokt et al. 2023)]MCR6506800.1 NVEALA domain-containing protein [Bacteroides muris (ex Fokt et al. 2023)]
MKKIMRVAFVAAFAAIAGYSVYESQKVDVISDLMLANTEALANSEVIVGQPCACVKYSWCMYFYPWEQWEEEGAFYN